MKATLKAFLVFAVGGACHLLFYPSVENNLDAAFFAAGPATLLAFWLFERDADHRL